jgi:sulfite exporter TauE/SafE
MNEFSYLSAFVVGLLGGVHCVGMCGGIVSAMTMSLDRTASGQFRFHMAYNTGRIGSYMIAGGLMGGLGLMLAGYLPVKVAQQGLLGLAGVFMVFLGLYLAGWWTILRRLEEFGGIAWKKIQPLGKGLLPVTSSRKAFLLGMLWGWIPCGLVYSVLIWSISAGSVLEGGLMMLSFGLGTLPNLLAMGIIAEKLMAFVRQPATRRAAGLIVIIFGAFTIYQAL